jgi:Cof subfamily protein (haloacid dehalogenase superfamily)
MEKMKGNLKYKLICSDLDKTLLVDNTIPFFNLEAIQRARDLGVKFVISTGRDIEIILHLLKQLNTENSENEYTICCSGAKIYENKNKKIIYINYLDNEMVKEAFEFGKKFSEIYIIFDTSDGVYIYNDEILKKEKDDYGYNYKNMEKMEDIKDLKIIRVVYTCKNKDYLNKILKEIKEVKIFDNKVDYYLTQNQFLEFNNLSVSKGEALKWLCNYLNIDIKETIAIGDSYNDVSMIKEAGIGACVKSANDDIKKVSDYICEKDFFEGSVKEVIEKFVIND